MDKITALIIDDEISAIRTLEGMLGQYFPQVEILGTAQGVNDAYDKATRMQPDMVFLDIEMPPLGSGFDFLKKCGDYQFGVIFTTAYPHYAIQAINDTQPWAYLVKPFSIHDLRKAVQTASEKVTGKKGSQEVELERIKLLVTDSRKGSFIVPADQLVFCRADGSTTDLHYEKNGRTEILTASRILRDFEEELPKNVFCRCHHSYLVNLNYVERFEHTGRNGIVYLKNGMDVPISVSKMELFAEQFYTFLHS